MRSQYAQPFLFIAALLATPGTAVSAPVHCHVTGAEKLTVRSGGAPAICAAVEKAIAKAAPNARYSADIKVLSPSRLSATLQVNGHTLPEQKFATMDRNLSQAAIERFARSLAAEVVKAAKQ